MKKFLVLTLMCVLGLFNLSAQEPETIVIGNGGDAINYSPSYIDSYTSVTQQIFVAEEMLAMRLSVMHNLYFYNKLMERIRDALDEERFEAFRNEYSVKLGRRI